MVRENKSALRDAVRLLKFSDPFWEQIRSLKNVLPEGEQFSEDTWDVITWETFRRNRRSKNLDFTKIRNGELRSAAKIYVLYLRFTKGHGSGSARAMIDTVGVLDSVVDQDVPVQSLNNYNFLQAQGLLIDQYVDQSGEPSSRAYLLACYLEGFGRFLQKFTGLQISFACGIDRPRLSGQEATAEGRDAKLIPLSVLLDLLSVLRRPSLSVKDTLCLQMLMVLIGTGFRLGELLVLAVDCLHEMNGILSIRYYSIKRKQMDLKPVAKVFAPAVRSAIEWIRELTQAGRQAAQAFREVEQQGEPGLDWDRIPYDPEATKYFVGQLLHTWTSDPRHQLFRPAGAWWDKKQRYVDVVSLLAEAGGNLSEVARQLGTDRQKVKHLLSAQEAARAGRLSTNINTGQPIFSFHKDSRVVSLAAIKKHIGSQVANHKLEPLVRQAVQLQFEGKVYPAPRYEEHLELEFRRRSQALIYGDQQQRLLEPWEALFVVDASVLGTMGTTRVAPYSVVGHETLVRFLSGTSSSSAGGQSAFERFDVRDPRTGEVAHFTSGQIRHWLNTMYLLGGVTHEQAALAMGHDQATNAEYDHRTSLERADQLRDAVRAGRAVGRVPKLYITLADHDLDQAEEFLLSSVRRYTPMPHGACIRDLELDPCPNQLACFADRSGEADGVCADYIADEAQPGIWAGLEALEQRQCLMLKMIDPQVPQAGLFQRVQKSVRSVMNSLEELHGRRREVANSGKNLGKD